MIRSYVIGFSLSIILTLLAYMMVTAEWFTGVVMMGAILGLALVQFTVQMIFFLHVNKKENRWNLFWFVMMSHVLFIIVAGSLWIMYHLNYNMMSPDAMDSYMLEQSSKGF